MKKRISEEELEELRHEDGAEEVNQNKQPVKKAREQKSVLLYITILFAVVLVLIALSYFIQQRNAAKTISDLTTSHDLFSTQALENIENLQNANLAYAAQVQEQEEQIEDLKQELEDARQNAAAALDKNDTLSMQIEEQKQRTYVLQALMDMMVAVQEGDKAMATGKARVIESSLDYLSEENIALYQTLLQQLQDFPEQAQ